MAILAFALTFNTLEEQAPHNGTQLATFGEPGLAGLQSSIWATFLFTILGDFDSSLFYNGGAAMITCFVLVTIITNIIMLNVLIAIVSQAQEKILQRQDATVRLLLSHVSVATLQH